MFQVTSKHCKKKIGLIQAKQEHITGSPCTLEDWNSVREILILKKNKCNRSSWQEDSTGPKSDWPTPTALTRHALDAPASIDLISYGPHSRDTPCHKLHSATLSSRSSLSPSRTYGPTRPCTILKRVFFTTFNKTLSIKHVFVSDVFSPHGFANWMQTWKEPEASTHVFHCNCSCLSSTRGFHLPNLKTKSKQIIFFQDAVCVAGF